MFSFRCFQNACRPRLCNSSIGLEQQYNVRHASLGSAINKGKGPKRGKMPWQGRGSVRKKMEAFDADAVPEPDPDRTKKRKYVHPPKMKPPKYVSTKPAWDYNTVTQHRPGDGTIPTKISIVAPKIIPYATAASEFIYGTSAVRAAIRCGRRKLYVFYIYDEGLQKPMTETLWEDPEMRALQKFALVAGARVRRVRATWLKMMDKMSNGRPNNGVILDASPLPRTPAVNMLPVESPWSTEFHVTVAQQPPEEAEINGTDGRFMLSPYRSTTSGVEVEDRKIPEKRGRYPFILLLDGVLDPGNLGGILRSAHYFGVDAVAFAARNSAPLSPVTMKASAGAAESVPLISVNSATSFVSESRKNGWRFIAAQAPGSSASSSSGSSSSDDTKSKSSRRKNTTLSTSDLSSQLRDAPCVLMLGGEGIGLSKKLSAAADATVAVPGAYTDKPDEDLAGVDSLNVSVATGLLCEAFFREWTDNPAAARKDHLGGREDADRVF